MATRSLKPKRDDSMLDDFKSMPELAPSSLRKEGTLWAQVLLFVGFFLVLVGGFALLAPLTSYPYFIRPGYGYALLTMGLCLSLYHCFVDPEPQFRKIYGLIGLALIASSLIIRVFPFAAGLGSYFLPVGVPALFVALLFLIGVARTETDPFWRTALRTAMLAVGAVGLAWGLGRGFFDANFLTGEGVVATIVGLVYLIAYLGLTGEREGDFGYTINLTLGIVGSAVFALAIIRSLVNNEFFIPSGLILASIGIAAALIAYVNISDRPTILLARREFLSYFCSPIGYLVIFGSSCIFGFIFWMFAGDISFNIRREPLFEPIVAGYVLSWFNIFALFITVPIITMRLLSEEKRSGSLEVLLTAPIDETSIVMGKFLAALLFFLVTWLPYFLFMVSFRIFGDQEFDYRPLLSFAPALAVTGGAFIAMGLFFSSLTSNQIVAAALTFAGLLLAFGLFFVQASSSSESIREMINYVSFVQLWRETGQGFVPVRYFVSQIMIAAFFLFLTTLTLAARKWK